MIRHRAASLTKVRPFNVALAPLLSAWKETRSSDGGTALPSSTCGSWAIPRPEEEKHHELNDSASAPGWIRGAAPGWRGGPAPPGQQPAAAAVSHAASASARGMQQYRALGAPESTPTLGPTVAYLRHQWTSAAADGLQASVLGERQGVEESGAGLMAGSEGRSGEFRERTYARSLDEYQRVLEVLSSTGRAYLMRDVYEDMMMDGIVPQRRTYHILIVGCKRQRRLQDALFFFDAMKAQGILPDVVLFNCIIEACGLAGHINAAFKVAEQMESLGMKPQQRTFIALLNACSISGRVEEALGVLQRMRAHGLPMDHFCYSSLIGAYKNSFPNTSEKKDKVYELLEQYRKAVAVGQAEPSKAQLEGEEDGLEHEDALEADEDGEDGEAVGVQAQGDSRTLQGYAPTKQDPRLVVYRAALRSMVQWRDSQGGDRLLKMMREDGIELDDRTRLLLIQLWVRTWEMDRAVGEYSKMTREGLKLPATVVLMLISGAIGQRSAEGRDLAKRLFAEFEAQGGFLSTVAGIKLLSLASNYAEDDFSLADTIFAHIAHNSRRQRRIVPGFGGVAAYIRGLQRLGVPGNDPRLQEAQALFPAARLGVNEEAAIKHNAPEAGFSAHVAEVADPGV